MTLKERAYQLLRASERYTKTDMVYLAGNGGWLVLAHLVIGLIALATSVAFAHLVPKEAYGNYRFLLSIFWILTAFSLTGIPTALTRAVARGEDGSYPAAVRFSILWSMPMLLIGLGTAGYYYVNGNMLLALGCLAIGLIGPFMQGAYLFGPLLEGKRAFKQNSIAGIVLNAVPALLVLASMAFTDRPELFLVLYLAGSVATGFAISWYFARSYKLRDTGMSPELKSLSGHFSAMNILLTISQQVDRVLVFHYLGAVELAVYAFATAIPDQMKTVFNNVATLALPKFVQRPFEEVRSSLLYRLAGFTALIALGVFLYIVAAPFVFHILFPTYPEAVGYSQLYALALIPIGSVIPFTLLEAHAAKKELYVYNIAGPVFQIGMLFFLITGYGLLGAVVARILGRLFYFFLSFILLYTRGARSTSAT